VIATHHHSAFPPERVAAEREASVSVCLPARDEAATIGPIVERLVPLVEAGVVDEVVVVDASTDGTAGLARAAGAAVHAQADLLPEWGPVLGKGDAMWRALSVLRGEVVVFLDADSEDLGAHYATALAGAVAVPGGAAFAKGFYRRPFRVGETVLPSGGGRVTELTARPLLNLLFPDLAGMLQPLAGEVAARRDLLERLPVLCGYAVDVALLIDAHREVGTAGLAQVDLDVRQNRHQPLEELGPMAFAVAAAIAARAHAEGRLAEPPPARYLGPAPEGLRERRLELVERPPMGLLRERPAALSRRSGSAAP